MVEMDRMIRNIYDMMGNIEREFQSMRRMMHEELMQPAMDIYETDDEIVLQVEMPGVKREDISIEISGNAIEISAEKKATKEENIRGYYHKEIVSGKLYRRVELPMELSLERIKAKYNDGVLEIRIKKEKEEKKRVPVE